MNERLLSLFQMREQLLPVMGHFRDVMEAFDNSAMGVMITSGEATEATKILYVNKTLCDMSGWSREELVGLTTVVLSGPKTDPSVLEKMHESALRGETSVTETCTYRKDGSSYQAEWDVSPVRTHGEVIKWIFMMWPVRETAPSPSSSSS